MRSRKADARKWLSGPHGEKRRRGIVFDHAPLRNKIFPSRCRRLRFSQITEGMAPGKIVCREMAPRHVLM
jgi:hypothetical protein